MDGLDGTKIGLGHNNKYDASFDQFRFRHLLGRSPECTLFADAGPMGRSLSHLICFEILIIFLNQLRGGVFKFLRGQRAYLPKLRKRPKLIVVCDNAKLISYGMLE